MGAERARRREGQPPTGQARRGLPTDPHPLLALQRQFGNRAVSRLVAKRAEVRVRVAPERPATRLARAVMEFGVQIGVGKPQGDANAAYHVTAVNIGGRPHGLFGSADRSHTTAWVVFKEALLRAIVHQPLPTAMDRVIELINEVDRLPGAQKERLDAAASAVRTHKPAGPTRATAETVTARQAFDDAKAAAANAVAEAQTVKSRGLRDLQVQALQNLAEAYLRLRNLVPLSATYDRPVATGHGEGTTRKSLEEQQRRLAAAAEKDAENAAAELDAKAAQLSDQDVAEKLWALLDAGAVAYLTAHEPEQATAQEPFPRATAPGNLPGEDRANRLGDVIAQHLITVRRVWPTLYLRSGIGSDFGIWTYAFRIVTAHRIDGVDLARVLARVRTRVPSGDLQGFTDMPQAAPQVAQALGPPAIEEKGAVQLRFANVNGRAVITSVNIGARPLGVIWGSEGAHMTAWALMAEGLKSAVIGKTWTEARDAVSDLYTWAKHLPVLQRREDLPAKSAWLLEDAARAAGQAEQRTRAELDPEQQIPALQELIAAYLRFRNTVPLSAAEVGGPHDTRGESKMLARLRRAEPDPAAADFVQLVYAMWGLLDAPALVQLGEASDKYYAPGIRASSGRETLQRFGLVIRTHVLSVEQAFPNCYRHVGFGSEESVGWFLGAQAPWEARRGRKRRQEDVEDEVLAKVNDNRIFLDPIDRRAVCTYVRTGAFPPEEAQPVTVGTRRSSRPQKRARFSSEYAAGEKYDVEIDEYVDRT